MLTIYECVCYVICCVFGSLRRLPVVCYSLSPSFRCCIVVSLCTPFLLHFAPDYPRHVHAHCSVFSAGPVGELSHPWAGSPCTYTWHASYSHVTPNPAPFPHTLPESHPPFTSILSPYHVVPDILISSSGPSLWFFQSSDAAMHT